jgi:soluble lytic murein transglycosylase
MKKNKSVIIIFILILIAFIFLIAFKNSLLKIIYPKKFQEIVAIYQEEYSVEENLIFALIKAESNFDADAVSNKNAIGLMQLMEETAKDVARKSNIEMDYNNMKEELKDCYKNINIGTKYLATLLEKYGNKEVALAAYNAGIGTVDNWIEKEIIKADGSDIENIPYKETNNYVRKILRDYKIYEDLYKN